MFDHYSHIEDYLANRLEPKEKQAFEEEMQSNQELNKIVENHSVYKLIADAIIDQDLSNKIKNQQQTGVVNKTAPKRSKYFILMGIVILFSLVALFFFFNKESKAERIYIAYYTQPIDQYLRGDQVDQLKYLKACDRGHVQMDLERFDQAEKSFLESIGDENSTCQEKSRYYLSLIYIKQADFEKAKINLQKIGQNEESGFEQKAINLLTELD